MSAVRFCLLLLLAFGASPALAAEPASKPTLRELVLKSRVELQELCERVRENAKQFDAKPMDPPVETALFMHCECLPEKLDQLLASDAVTGEGGMPDAQRLIKPLFLTCGATIMRRQARQACERLEKLPEGAKDLSSYCGCVSAELDKATDEQLVVDSIAAHRSFEAIVRARKAGTPEPPKHQGLAAAAEASCAAQASH